MKKILSLGTAAAVLSLTAIAASAAIAPTIVGTPVEGEEVTVEIVANGMTQEGTQFTVVTSDNLTLTGYEAYQPSGSFAFLNEASLKFAGAYTGVPADGTVLLTLTFTVDAAADDEITVNLVPDEGFLDIDGDVAAAVVVAGASEEPDESEEPWYESEESEEPWIVESEESEEPGESTDNNNPPTGVALAVVPAALAGAAIVVAKKRK